MSGSGGTYLSAEDRARVKIDRALEQAGWVVQSSDRVNLGAGRGVAVREFILQSPHGRPDYLLYVDRKPVGAIEAKPDGTTLTEVEGQSIRYSGGLPQGIEAPVLPLPFIYESTGAETRFTNLSDPEPRSRPVFCFHRPETLVGWIRWIMERPTAPTLLARLQQLPPAAQGNLWEVQAKAVRSIEVSLRDNKPRTLVQMTTGSGKTFTAVHLCYRLIRYADAARVLFLVDRSTLGIQTEGEFQGFTIAETGRQFTQEYGVQRLTHNRIEPSARVCISTIQRMYSILRGDAEMNPELDNQSADTVAPKRAVEVAYNPAVPPETFDVVIIDECHRSIYTVWRQVVEYFDAYLIGLTATPSKATYGFFRRNVVMEYSHADAVVDNVNVDYSVYNIRTTITEQGSTIAEGEWAGFRKRKDRTMRWAQLDEPRVYFNKDLDRTVVTPDQIRTIIQTFRDRLFTEIFPGRSAVPKTLIFAKTDSHADDVVQIVREEFNRGNEFAQKITYRTTDGDPEVLLLAFRNSPNPRVVVTVDMIATGTDVKPIECLLFMRDVKSRTYFEQMLGRGVRVIDDTAFQAVTPDPAAKCKDGFVVVDAVGVLSSRFVDSVQPLERKPRVPSERILRNISYGMALDPDEASSLASRLLKLELQIRPGERDRLRELAGGLSLQQIAAGIVDALDPDRQHDAAAAETGRSDPTPQDVIRAGKAMLEVALRPLADNPDLRQAILDLGREPEQTIDEVSLDSLIEVGYSGRARERAEALTRDFRRFIDEHRDEIYALQVLYSRPYRKRLTFDAAKELSDAIERPPQRWTTERLWRAYDLLDRSKVRGSGERRLADIVSLVRYALQQENELVPFEETARARFESWLTMQEQRGATFTPEQRTWLEWMRDVIATDLGISDAALDYPPFLTHGGLPRALQVFGERLRPLMEELTETLTA